MQTAKNERATGPRLLRHHLRPAVLEPRPRDRKSSTLTTRLSYLADVSAVHDDVSAVMFTHLNLHNWCNHRHHDRYWDAEVAAMVGERQSVVTGTSCYHSLLPLFLHIHDSALQSAIRDDSRSRSNYRKYNYCLFLPRDAMQSAVMPK